MREVIPFLRWFFSFFGISLQRTTNLFRNYKIVRVKKDIFTTVTSFFRRIDKKKERKKKITDYSGIICRGNENLLINFRIYEMRVWKKFFRSSINRKLPVICTNRVKTLRSRWGEMFARCTERGKKKILKPLILTDKKRGIAIASWTHRYLVANTVTYRSCED